MYFTKLKIFNAFYKKYLQGIKKYHTFVPAKQNNGLDEINKFLNSSVG